MAWGAMRASAFPTVTGSDTVTGRALTLGGAPGIVARL